MNRTVYHFEPAITTHPDVIAFYPFTFNGNARNSSERLQAVADQVGVMILAAEMLGQSTKTIFDMKTQDALRPGSNFKTTSQRNAEWLVSQLAEYPKRLGIGHSLGGVTITGAQRYAEQPPFTAIQLCDAFNLRAPQKNVAGHIFFAGYQIVDAVQHRARSLRTPQKATGHQTATAISGPERQSENSLLRNIENLRPLMLSLESKQGAIALAQDATLPLHVIGLNHGMAGPKHRLEPFINELRAERAAATSVLHDAQAVPFLAEQITGWHSDLVDASLVSHNLQRTLQTIV